MPLLHIQTNAQVSSDQKETLLRDASQCVAELLGKAERYVMVALHDDLSMHFAGTSEPAALLELKSIGLAEDRAAEFSEKLCAFVETHLSISPERIYIEFTNAPRHLWGWNRTTF